MIYRLLLLCLLLSTSLHSYSQNLLKNIASSDASVNINQSFLDYYDYVIKGDTLFFFAQDTSFTNSNFNYKNIWFTNGNAANTKRVTNGNQTYYNHTYHFLAYFKGKAYYVNSTNSNLYATDGNDITLVKDFQNITIPKASVIGGWLYLFVSNNNTNTLELWKTGGTDINTSKVTDIYSGTHYIYEYSHFLNSGDKIYFNLYTTSHGSEPWITDGTAVGTKILKDIVSGSESSSPFSFEKVGNTVFFNAYNPSYPWGLWKTDGTEAGTILVADGNTYYNPTSGINYADQLYFIANENKFYKTDGNTVILVHDNLSMSWHIVKMNDLMYFIIQNGSEYELWKSDGSIGGTEKIKTILSHSGLPFMDVRMLAGASKIYFQLSHFSNGGFENITQHWVSDGTTAGTININTLNPNFSTGSYNNQLAVVGDTYYFTAYDAVNGFELWKSNGTSGGTAMVKNINRSIPSSQPKQFVGLNNDVFFSADDIKYGREIWKTDGIPANTRLFADYNNHSGTGENYSADITGMIAYNDVIIAQISRELVKFNRDMPPTLFYSHDLSNPENPEFIKYNNKIFYKGYDGYNNGYELFATDGNTVSKVKDLATGNNGGNPTNFVVWGSLLYFSTENNTKIWKSDGTEIGTVLVKSFSTGSIKSKFYGVNGVLMFVYHTTANGDELWKTKGTEIGTTIVNDINKGPGKTEISNLVVYNDNLFFTANNAGQLSLHKSDGTDSNTYFFCYITHSKCIPTVFKNKLFLVDYDVYSSSYYLYSTDGISAPFKIKPLAASTYDTILMNVNNDLLVFDIVPNDSRHELWASDGTAGGTKLVKVIRQKKLSHNHINIWEYFYHNSKLYFAADDGITGVELWVWDFNCPESMTITNAINQNTDFIVDKHIVGSNKINSDIKVSYNANKYIALNPGFETQSGTRFTASMSGCIGPATLSNSTTDTDEPVFKNFPTKANTTPVVIQFLNYPSNAELLSAYLSEKSNHNEQNIAWIISESQDKYILKMQVDGKEFTGYLPK